jgi:hypothetical protein
MASKYHTRANLIGPDLSPVVAELHKGRAETFDQLQANIKNLTHGTPVDTTAFRDGDLLFGFAYISECCRLGIIGGGWPAMRNSMVANAAAMPLAHQCASWELECCPGTDTYVGDQRPSSVCPHCYQDVPSKGSFRPTHKRPARS